MADSSRGRGKGAGEPTPDQVVGGRRTYPPGSNSVSPRRPFLNPYIAKLAEYPDLILEGEAAEARRGRWLDTLPNDHPVHVEIGSGNGFFLRDMCLRHPDRAFVGVEIRYKRVWMAARKLDRAGCTNGRVVLYHAGYLGRLFAEGEVAEIYLNHPDPWPKDKHARNRIITPAFADMVCDLLVPGGLFQIKSDCAPYADACRSCFAPHPMTEEAFAADLHREGEPLAEGNIVTNYERKFVEKGEPVFLQRWRKRDGQDQV